MVMLTLLSRWRGAIIFKYISPIFVKKILFLGNTVYFKYFFNFEFWQIEHFDFSLSAESWKFICQKYSVISLWTRPLTVSKPTEYCFLNFSCQLQKLGLSASIEILNLKSIWLMEFFKLRNSCMMIFMRDLAFLLESIIKVWQSNQGWITIYFHWPIPIILLFFVSFFLRNYRVYFHQLYRILVWYYHERQKFDMIMHQWCAAPLTIRNFEIWVWSSNWLSGLS